MSSECLNCKFYNKCKINLIDYDTKILIVINLHNMPSLNVIVYL
jgi:hypothetical protein